MTAFWRRALRSGIAISIMTADLAKDERRDFGIGCIDDQLQSPPASKIARIAAARQYASHGQFGCLRRQRCDAEQKHPHDSKVKWTHLKALGGGMLPDWAPLFGAPKY